MNPWTESDVAFVYYSALFLALVAGIGSIWYVGSIRTIFNKILGKGVVVWGRTFATTLILAGLLGAMSVSLKDCDGNYNDMTGNPRVAIQLGLEELELASRSLASVAGTWFLLLMVVLFSARQETKVKPIYKILTGVVLVLGILGCYEIATGGITKALYF